MNENTERLTGDELELIRIFRRLNAAGKESLLQQAVMHSHIPALQKWWKSEGRITYIGEHAHRDGSDGEK